MLQLYVSCMIIYKKYKSLYLINAVFFLISILTFQNQPTELWNEVTQLTAALRITEEAPPLTAEQNFYVKMFEHISYEVQHKILLLIAGQSENNLEHCRLILLLMKRFPQVIVTHSVSNLLTVCYILI